MKIDILICTYNEGINRVETILLPSHIDIRYKISHQLSNEKYSIIPTSLSSREDVTVSQIRSIGLSKNRNNCISIAEEDICLIADDDVRYEMHDILLLLEKFKKHPEIDLIAGKIKTYEGEGPYKKYSDYKHKISISKIGGISSIEIAFRRERIVKNKLNFDTRFGLGGELFKKGEEAAFLSDCLKCNLKIRYFPIYIVKHHQESSGTSVIYDEAEAMYMGALSWRIFKNLSYPMSLIFMIKHWSRYRKKISPRNYLSSFIKGVKYIKSNR